MSKFEIVSDGHSVKITPLSQPQSASSSSSSNANIISPPHYSEQNHYYETPHQQNSNTSFFGAFPHKFIVDFTGFSSSSSSPSSSSFEAPQAPNNPSSGTIFWPSSSETSKEFPESHKKAPNAPADAPDAPDAPDVPDVPVGKDGVKSPTIQMDDSEFRTTLHQTLSHLAAAVLPWIPSLASTFDSLHKVADDLKMEMTVDKATLAKDEKEKEKRVDNVIGAKGMSLEDAQSVRIFGKGVEIKFVR
jgi:hypothetical protein